MYHTFQPDNSAHGSNTIIIRKGIKHEDVKYFSQGIQATTVTITSAKQLLSLMAIYCLPRYTIKVDHMLNC